MNLYQVGYYRKDAGNVVTLINSIIVKEEKQHFYELSTDCLVPALKHLVSEQQAIAYLEGNKEAIQKLCQQIQAERGELRGFEKIKACARQLFK